MSKSSVFKLRLKVLNSSAERQLCDSEFHTEGALTLKALADNESAIRGTESNIDSRAPETSAVWPWTWCATELAANVAREELI